MSAPAPWATLLERWLAEASLLRWRGLDREATFLESCARDLEEHAHAWAMEALTLEEAADESGYSYSALQQKVAGGEIPNAGERGAPRILRRDLPLKARPPRPTGRRTTHGAPPIADLLLERSGG